MNPEMEQVAIPVDGRNLGWAKSAYAMNGVPIVQIVPLGNGQYAIVIMAPAGAPPPDWRTLRTYRRPPFWRRIEPIHLMIAVNLVAIVALGWLLVNGAPAALVALMPGAGEPIVNVLPDAGGFVDDLLAPVQDALDTATRAAMGVITLAVGLVVLWLLWAFRGTISGIVGMLRRDKAHE